MWHGSVLLYRYEPRILEFLEEGRSLNFSKLGAKNLVVKGRGGEGVEWIRYKRKFVMKITFTDNIEWSSKYLWKIISVDVKANKNNKKIKDLLALSYKFL